MHIHPTSKAKLSKPSPRDVNRPPTQSFLCKMCLIWRRKKIITHEWNFFTFLDHFSRGYWMSSSLSQPAVAKGLVLFTCVTMVTGICAYCKKKKKSTKGTSIENTAPRVQHILYLMKHLEPHQAQRPPFTQLFTVEPHKHSGWWCYRHVVYGCVYTLGVQGLYTEASSSSYRVLPTALTFTYCVDGPHSRTITFPGDKQTLHSVILPTFFFSFLLMQ